MLGNSGYGHCRRRQQQQQQRRYTCVMPKSDALNILFWINIYTGYFCAVYSRSSISLFCVFSVRCSFFGCCSCFWCGKHMVSIAHICVNRMENLVLVNRRMDESMNNAPTKKTYNTYTLIHTHSRHECAKNEVRLPKKRV